MNPDQLQKHLVDKMGLETYRSTQIFEWLYRRTADSFAGMSSLGKDLRNKLDACFEIHSAHIHQKYESNDGTIKYQIRLADDLFVESVLIPIRGSLTLCISSQVGCPVKCSFCYTGAIGYARNLSPGEIVDQVVLVNRDLCQKQGAIPGTRTRFITNIVFMGMGEPLLNYRNVVNAIKILLDSHSFQFSKRRITLSTAGHIPKIRKLAEECPVRLAISLHAPTDELRNQLVPLNRKYPLKDLLLACRDYPLGKRDHITFEYTLLKGVNDSLGHARQLVKILKGIRSKVNLIPFNPHPAAPYSRPNATEVRRFQNLLKDHGLKPLVRTTRGEDINAACGQLGSLKPRSLRGLRKSEMQKQLTQ